MTEMKCPEVISGFVAYPEMFDQFFLRARRVSNNIDLQRNPNQLTEVSAYFYTGFRSLL